MSIRNYYNVAAHNRALGSARTAKTEKRNAEIAAALEGVEDLEAIAPTKPKMRSSGVEGIRKALLAKLTYAPDSVLVKLWRAEKARREAY